MTGLQILLVAVGVLVVIAAATIVWIRRRRTGGVLISDAHGGTGRREGERS
jgi:hypothetical protein